MPSPRVLRDCRADCEIGDWVAAGTVPEWDLARAAYPFVVSGDASPPVPDSAVPPFLPALVIWSFRRGTHFDGRGNTARVWFRES